MVSGFNQFDIVKKWWGSRPVQPDTNKQGIDLSTAQGAFESLILGILYSIEDTGSAIPQTLNTLRNNGYTDNRLLSRISPNSGDLDKMNQIFKSNYFHGRLALFITKQGHLGGKIMQIIENACDIVADQNLSGDLSKLNSLYSDNGYSTLKWLWKRPGIKKKAFWIMREMRMQGVWNVEGKYCCVPDEQVGSSLKRWGKITEWPDNPNFKLCLKVSQIVWDYFGELYDLPILHYARDHKCNSKALQRCTNCDIFPHCTQ